MSCLHIAIGIHNKNNYYVHALVMLFSIFRHTKAKITVHILHDETLTKYHILFFEKLINYFNGTLHLHFIDIDTFFPISKSMTRCFTVGSLFRLLVPTLIHEERVLYSDADIIFQTDIEEIFSMTADNNDYIMAVRDTLNLKHKQRLGVEIQCYFNSGIILFLAAKIHLHIPDFLARMNILLSKNIHFTHPDQDALNVFFTQKQYRCIKLPAKYNYLILVGQGADISPEHLAGKNLHYVGAKPWDFIYSAGQVYWNERQKVFALLNSITC